ncbi:ecotropic viral integration site 5 ortholog [Notothenia coriiceps]|uniref:Ecotropic viral integration site 5 ortholog n=1 Tax=Notothenia coriiceps TaxID=8208 RepID=A0A6I9NQI3_9TELE|nr:PREDICTED: ecotropic viral integration site 5 ortholog-like [Notothenia coriiceps]
MLSPKSQKNVSEEDSSGSDAGSEVGPEPETDRFGFILTNGSTAGTVGPPPELVRQRETKWINIISQWDRILLKKTSKVKVQCQKGIPASLRAKCWPLLCGATDKMKQTENLYQTLDSQPALQSWVDVIERDLDRQFPFHEMFLSKDGHGQRGLFRVLKAYTQHKPEEGYCQAQGPVAAVLLMNMPAEEAFWCLVQISDQYLPGYYSPLLEGVLFDAAMLTWVLKRTCPAAHKHLQYHGVEPLMFATDWLMCLFTRHLPFNTLLRVWDLFFCHGVRVLLQVAVVLVRRVLGRAEQRKQCPGQMETLERLRGVREEVQEEDDPFIAEVCSVQLSARDLEKQTEKELKKWRTDRPSSTFDPRGRCQGYRMAWASGRLNEEERDMKERAKGNLSVPLARSASTLSLSPALLSKRWGRGAKTNTREWESGGKVVRHLSMGAKEDCRSWAELKFKKVQGVQEEEDTVFEEPNKLTGSTEQKKLPEEPEKIEIRNMPTEHVEETVIKEQVEIAEKEETEIKETEESEMFSEQMEETTVETDQTKDQTVEDILHPAEQKQGEELDSDSHSQVLEQQSHESKQLEIEVKETNDETEKPVEEIEHTEENLTEIQKDADEDTITEEETQGSLYPGEEQMIQADVKPQESTESERQMQEDTEIKSEDEASTVETVTQQQEVITETDISSQGDAREGKYHNTESLAETHNQEESHTQTETHTEEQAQSQEGNAATQGLEAEKVQNDSVQHIDSKTEEETVISCSPDCMQPTEGTDVLAETDTEEEIAGANEIVMESSEGLEKECDAECTQEEEESCLMANSEAQVDNDLTQAGETQTETTDSKEPFEAETLPVEPDWKLSPEETSPSEEPAPEQPEIQVAMGPVEEEGSPEETSPEEEPEQPEIQVAMGAVEEEGSPEETSPSEEPEQPEIQVAIGAVEQEGSPESVHENTVGEDDVFLSTKPIDRSNIKSISQVRDCHPVKEQTEPGNSGGTEASGNRSSNTSGDLCVRKASSSRGPRLARRLSEDLFIMPEKTSQSKLTPRKPEAKDSAANTTQNTLSAATERAVVQPLPDPPKRFGLFRRLRGEQPKKAPKLQVPKILIQDFSDGAGLETPVEEEEEGQLSSRERRRRRREQERREKDEERTDIG